MNLIQTDVFQQEGAGGERRSEPLELSNSEKNSYLGGQ